MSAQQQQQEAETSAVESSPMRKTRQQEKEELAYLNDRFVTYIEQVRQMKESNLKLEVELSTVREQLGREAEVVKALYEAELSDARNLIDETANEKARQQILASKNAARVEEIEAELKSLKDELQKLEGRLTSSERNAASLDAQRKAALADKGRLNKQVKDLEAELEELRSTLDAMKETLEAETLSKVDLQNSIQSLREELAFRKKVYEEELAALRQKLTLSMSGNMEVDLATQIDSRLEVALDELREKSEMEIAQFKQEMEESYRDKVISLENQSARDATTINRITAEIRKISASVGDTNAELAKLKKANEKLEALLRAKEEEIARIRHLHSEETSSLVDELRELRANYEQKIHDYEELVDIRVHLDQEIATYRALLQEEENRLHLTPTPREKRHRSRTQTSEPKTKKLRMEASMTQQANVASSAAGFIQISDVDPTGKYVQIKNMSNQIESLGGFKILHEVDEGEEVVFRFHYKSRLQGGASVTVWGSKVEGALHNPPSDIVWKSQESWGTGIATVTKLMSNTGEVVATFTQRSESSPSKSRETSSLMESIDSGARSFPHIPEVSSGSTTTTSTVSTFTSRSSRERQQQQQQVGDEHMFHQKGDPHAPGKQDKCRIS